MEQGLIQVYTGNGKGKTTAAMGQALRAHGRGLRVIVFQLLKASDGSGEQTAFKGLTPPLPIEALGTGTFIFNRQPTKAEMDQAEAGWNRIKTALDSESFDVIVIDELSHAVNKGLLRQELVVAALRQKRVSVELVLTGRDMPEAIIELADLVTEMRMVKHPYQKGVAARSGIEY